MPRAGRPALVVVPNPEGVVAATGYIFFDPISGDAVPRRPTSAAYDDFINKLNDQDWGWWPFLRLRPPKDEPISMGRLVTMSLLYGVVYGTATIVLFASLGRARHRVPPIHAGGKNMAKVVIG